jgi:hypothetical protein
MKKNIFTGELTWKGVVAVLGVLAAGVGLFYGGPVVVQKLRGGMQSTASVKKQLFSYIEKKSRCSDFSVAATPQDSTAVSNEVASLRKEIKELQEQLAASQQLLRTNRDEYAAVSLELRQMKRAAGILVPRRARAAAAGGESNTVAVAEGTTNVFDVVAASKTNETYTPIAEKELGLAAKQAAISKLVQENQRLQNTLQARQRTATLKERELAGLLDGTGVEAKLARDCAALMQQPGSWESLYKALGQELWLADKWLGSTSTATRLAGLQLADQARGHALNVAENGWVAARICEAFIWPNLELGENNGNTALRDQYLVSAGLTFRQAEETNNYIRNAEMLISKSSNAARVDYARYQLGYMYELMGNYEASLKEYRSIQNTNSLVYAARRIPMVEARLKAQTPKKQ